MLNKIEDAGSHEKGGENGGNANLAEYDEQVRCMAGILEGIEPRVCNIFRPLPGSNTSADPIPASQQASSAINDAFHARCGMKEAKKADNDVAPDDFTINAQVIAMGFHLSLAQNFIFHLFYSAVALLYQKALSDLTVSVDNVVLEIEELLGYFASQSATSFQTEGDDNDDQSDCTIKGQEYEGYERARENMWRKIREARPKVTKMEKFLLRR